jgi:hypothetical protein
MNHPIKIFILLAICISCSDDDGKKACATLETADSFQYPIQPKTLEWNTLRSLQQRVDACQIPDNILAEMSTEGLLATLLNYPLIMDMYAWNFVQHGFNRIKNEQKGFAELYSRSDLFSVALERYEKMSVDCHGSYPPFIQGEGPPTPLAFATFEMVLLQDEFLDILNEDQTLQLFKNIFYKLEEKNIQPDESSSKWVSYAILGKIMLKSNYAPFLNLRAREEFLESFITEIPSHYLESDIHDEILKHAKSFIELHG